MTRLTAWMGAGSVVLLLIGGLALAGPDSTDGSSSSSSSSTTAATTPSTTGSTVDDGSSTSSTSVTLPDDDQVSTTTSTSLPDDEAPGSVEGIFTFAAGDAGEVTVQVVDGRMSLVSTTTNPGWVLEEIRAESDRVRAEFERGDDEVKLELRLEGGAIEVTLEARSED
ncbi:MAG: hypothetical protein ACRDXD_07925 [Acidimicrobiia bacterium]